MKMEFQAGLEQKQTQLLSQTQIQSLQILSMDHIELHDYLQNEYLENPIFEYTSTADAFHSLDELYYNKGKGNTPSEPSETGYSKEFAAPEQNPVEALIKEQLNPRDISEFQWKMIHFMIQNLDECGFLPLEPAEISSILKCSLSAVTDCLNRLKGLEPKGIFSKNLSECLLVQLNDIGDLPAPLRSIVTDYLEEVADGKISKISRALNISTIEVRKYIALIEKLNPRPFTSFTASTADYIVPDIIYSKADGMWEIRLNDKWIGNYKLNEYYLKLMNSAKDKELSNYFQEKYRRAQWILQSLEQRKKTILQIANAVLMHQVDYFEERGPLKAMTMNDLASQLDMHPSTVSRAIRGKYVQFPKMTVLFRSLFITAATHSGSNQITANDIKYQIKELIDNENRQKPLSDQKITQLLKDKGIELSRRAAAKYRDELGIKGSFDRKFNG